MSLEAKNRLTKIALYNKNLSIEDSILLMKKVREIYRGYTAECLIFEHIIHNCSYVGLKEYDCENFHGVKYYLGYYLNHLAVHMEIVNGDTNKIDFYALVLDDIQPKIFDYFFNKNRYNLHKEYSELRNELKRFSIDYENNAYRLNTETINNEIMSAIKNDIR